MKDVSCPVCGGGELRGLFAAREFLCGIRTEYRLVCCARCGVAFVNPQPTPEELAPFYVADYHGGQDCYRSLLFSWFGFDKVKAVTRLAAGGRILDVGCGDGSFLERMVKRGWQGQGVDTAPEACRLSAQKLGPENVFCGDVFSDRLCRASYDVVTFWHALEHLPDPVGALRRVGELLKEDGVVVVASPNFGSVLRRIFRGRWYPLHLPYHLTHFTPLTLERAFAEAGLRIEGQRRHFVDPLSNFGSLKMSLLLAFASGHMQWPSLRGAAEGAKTGSGRSFWWKALRFLFNAATLALSFFLALLGNEETMLMWAKKKDVVS